SLLMKSRLGQSALSAMELTFAGQHAFTQESLRYLEPAALCEVPAVGDQDVFDVFRIVDEIDPLSSDLEVNQVSILPRKVRQIVQRIAPKPEQRLRKPGVGPRRQNVPSSRRHACFKLLEPPRHLQAK